MEIPWLLFLFHLSFKQCRVANVFVYLDMCIFDYLCNCGSVFFLHQSLYGKDVSSVSLL